MSQVQPLSSEGGRDRDRQIGRASSLKHLRQDREDKVALLCVIFRLRMPYAIAA